MPVPHQWPVVSFCVAAAIVLAGCTGGKHLAAKEITVPTPTIQTTPMRSPAPPKPDPAPNDDACYLLPAKALSQAGNEAPSIGCKKAHTTQTIAVQQIPKKVVGKVADPDTQAIARYVVNACDRAFDAHVGGSTSDRVLSRLDSVWFAPSGQQLALGARWYRCDVAAYTTDTKLARLPRSVQGLLDSDSSLDTYGVCSTGEPSAAKSDNVMCARPHRWRAFEIINLGGPKKPWPGQRAAGDDSACSADARSYLGLPLKWRFGWTPPTKEQWELGRHYGLCWVPE